jgi:hypothetical protein
MLSLLRQRGDLMALRLVGRSDMDSQEMAPGSHRRMHLRAITAFGAVIACPSGTFECRVPGAAVENGRRGLLCMALGHAPQRAQVMHNSCKHTRLEPALALVVHRLPGEQVMR